MNWAPRLARARRSAAACGVTRLAEVTGLDRIGVHVFQAVRPEGRSLSVHQGKGLVREAAMIGALMEAVEADHAEWVECSAWFGCYRDLPSVGRARSLSVFSAGDPEAVSEDEALAWIEARRLLGGPPLWVPRDCVSLDFTEPSDQRFERSSSGLGAHFDAEAALVKALLELIERDAEQAWFNLSPDRRTHDQVSSESIEEPRFRDLKARLTKQGFGLSIYLLPAIVPLPVILAELRDTKMPGTAHALAAGSACGLDPDEALISAVVEAIQSRLTSIAGVRDDIFHAPPPPPNGFGVALPPAPHIRPRLWPELVGLFRHARPTTSRAIAAALAEAGYPGASFVDLSRSNDDANVFKAIVPGLGLNGRARMPPQARS